LNRTPRLIESKVQALAALLREKGMSVTHQRLTVYRALLEDVTHPDADQLLNRVRRQLPSISLGTVYKALDTLKELGAVLEVDSPKSATRYEALVEPHHHLICDVCEQILDLHEPAYTNLRPPARAAAGFVVASCTVQFRGRCRRCSLKYKPSRQPRRRPQAGPLQGGS
jgi:Fe2+ or Zn2+ uptake regulation protein